MKNKIDKKQLIELKKHGLFGERKSVKECKDYCMLYNGSERMVAFTAMYILYNTIAENYYLVEKEK